MRGARRPGAGLIRIDHIAQALPEGQLDSWILFFRAVLGLEPEAPFELPDPYGLVHSRAVASANRALRFPLNVSQSRNTATARSVSTLAGAGVHHIAFESADIFATLEKLRGAGLRLLAIPANYYDDLAARFPLSDDLVDKLRLNGLLYDKLGEGELLQAYTEPFQDGSTSRSCSAREAMTSMARPTLPCAWPRSRNCGGASPTLKVVVSADRSPSPSLAHRVAKGQPLSVMTGRRPGHPRVPFVADVKSTGTGCPQRVRA